MVPDWRCGETKLFSEIKHKNTRRNTVFLSETHTHTLWIPDGTNMVPHWRREEDRILGTWYYQTRATSILTESQQSPRDSKEDSSKGGPRVLVLYQEGRPAVFQKDCGAIPGNSQRCSTRYKFPRRRQRWSMRPEELYQESWNRSSPWVLVLYQEDWDRSGPRGGDWIPGNSRRCSARYKFPRRWRRLDLHQQQEGASIPMGLRHLYRGSVVMASTGSQLFKVHTGSLTLALFIPCHY